MSKWTQEELDTMITMRNSRRSFQEVAITLNRTEQACRWMAKKIGLRALPRTKQERQESVQKGQIKRPNFIPCLRCRKMFNSWDRCKNRLCYECGNRSVSNLDF